MTTFNNNQTGLPKLSETYWKDFKSGFVDEKVADPIIENVLTTNFSGNLNLEDVSVFKNKQK